MNISTYYSLKDAGGPLCLRFWTHMFGHGVGSLNVYVRAGAKDRKIWGLTGDAGNNWYMGQAPIASTDNFRVSIDSDNLWHATKVNTNLRFTLHM